MGTCSGLRQFFCRINLRAVIAKRNLKKVETVICRSETVIGTVECFLFKYGYIMSLLGAIASYRKG
jgi:hypothetical protein